MTTLTGFRRASLIASGGYGHQKSRELHSFNYYNGDGRLSDGGGVQHIPRRQHCHTDPCGGCRWRPSAMCSYYRVYRSLNTPGTLMQCRQDAAVT